MAFISDSSLFPAYGHPFTVAFICVPSSLFAPQICQTASVVPSVIHIQRRRKQAVF
jgi:hypothetical protein